jgi:adenosylcobinamide-phosphate synthase
MPRPWSVALGMVCDRYVGEPPEAVHPVALFGNLMQAVERRIFEDSRRAGVAYTAVGVGTGLVAGILISSTAGTTAIVVAGRALDDAAFGVARAIEVGDLDEARRLLPSLVGRDTSQLDEKEIVRAVVESVAENTVDAVVAPAVWAACLGRSAALTYRAINTMDAMVGHRSERYLRFGWASARADDVASWLPARVSAALVAIVRPRFAPQVWRALRTQAPDHPSPNAGVIEAAFAAALGVRLGGRNAYGDREELRPALGTGRAPELVDITRAVDLSRQVRAALVLIMGVVGSLVLARQRQRETRRP